MILGPKNLVDRTLEDLSQDISWTEDDIASLYESDESIQSKLSELDDIQAELDHEN